MKLNKGDGPKVAVLIVGIVLAGGFFAKTLLGVVGSHSAPPAGKPVVRAEPVDTTKSNLPPSLPLDTHQSDPNLAANSVSLANPFRRTVADPSETRQPTSIPRDPAPLRPISTNQISGPSLPVVPDSGFQPMNITVAEVLPKLEGVVLGEEALAVTSTASVTKFLHLGDRVAPGLFIADISKSAVRLRGKKKSALWRIGDPLPQRLLR